MTAKRPGDRPQAMSEVIALLEDSRLPTDERPEKVAVATLKSGLMVPEERPRGATPPAESTTEPSVRRRRAEVEGFAIHQEFNLEDSLTNPITEKSRTDHKSRTTAIPLKRKPRPTFRAGSRHIALALCALASGLVLTAFVGLMVVRRQRQFPRPYPHRRSWPPKLNRRPNQVLSADLHRSRSKRKRSSTARVLAAGCSAIGPLPRENIQAEGLNPHRSGSYLVVYDQQIGDFDLDFDYKLSKGCNSGVFLRVSDLNNPVNTGIEVALDDTTRGDDHDSGAFDGLVAPKARTQKPSGQWNHMTIVGPGTATDGFIERRRGLFDRPRSVDEPGQASRWI